MEVSNHLPSLIQLAESEDWTNRAFLSEIINYEQQRRSEKLIERIIKVASFPLFKTLEKFNFKEIPSLSKKQFNQLKELTWMEQLYNLVLLGPTGVGKTFLATGLGIEAIQRGYKVTFISMGGLIHTLKTEDISRKYKNKLKILESQI